MSDGSQFIDIVIFAMVAVFLGLRLRSVLGKRTGNEQPPFRGGMPPKPGQKPGRDTVIDIVPNTAPEPPPGTLAARLAAIGARDSSFTEERFKQGAAAAFEMIVKAFASDDERALRPLLSDEVFENFSQAIRSRQKTGEMCQNQLVRLRSVEITDAQLDGSMARIAVKYESEQIIVVRDAKGVVIEGDPSRQIMVTDLWTFARDTRARDPNWLLVATSSPDQ